MTVGTYLKTIMNVAWQGISHNTLKIQIKKWRGSTLGFWERVKEQVNKDAGIIKTIKLEYLGGHPKIKGKIIEICETSNSNTLKINRNEFVVTDMDWDEKHSRNAGNAGKAAAGAIIGGLATYRL